MDESPAHRDIVVIGASAGGLAALQPLIAELPAGFPAAVLVVMHSGVTSQLAAILDRADILPAVSLPIRVSSDTVATPGTRSPARRRSRRKAPRSSCCCGI